ncbi:MAG: hypothetical protein LBL26_02440, partial [Peptococcaceae bacterium]|nr:hypothetical protein [Peptococcaceae bacterium]
VPRKCGNICIVRYAYCGGGQRKIRIQRNSTVCCFIALKERNITIAPKNAALLFALIDNHQPLS